MNKRKAITKAVPAARSDDPLAPSGSLTCTIDMAELRRMTMADLRSLRDVLHHAQGILAAFSCQPRFAGEAKYSQNTAGDVLESICDFLAGYETAVINVAKSAKPTSAREAEWQSWMLLNFYADMTDDLAEFAVMASEAVKNVAKVKFHEDHKRVVA